MQDYIENKCIVQWEYKSRFVWLTRRQPTDLDNILNDEGQDGWEAFSMNCPEHSDNNGLFLWCISFKRQHVATWKYTHQVVKSIGD